MSAIIGLFHPTGKPVDPTVLDTMLAALGHRGPDGAGAWHAGPVALGQQHRQLTPESCNERLPRHDPLAGLTLVADCRLDNREDLCEALAVPQCQHAHTSDSQLLLLAYQQWGSQCVDHLLGDFAFAIWNQRTRVLFCACDHMGMRPLYIYQDPTCFAFATEIKGLLAHAAIPTRLNKRKLACLTVPGFDVLDAKPHDPPALAPGGSLRGVPGALVQGCCGSLAERLSRGRPAQRRARFLRRGGDCRPPPAPAE